MFQIFIVLSNEADTILLPSTEKLTEETKAECALKERIIDPFRAFQILIV